MNVVIWKMTMLEDLQNSFNSADCEPNIFTTYIFVLLCWCVMKAL